MADLPDTSQPTETAEDDSSMWSIIAISQLEKNLDNKNFVTRQQAARSILDTLQVVWVNQEDVSTVMGVMCRLARDTETNVRVELISQVPSVALFCHQRDNYLGTLIRQHLIPLLVDAFADDQPSVRKSSHNAFVVLLEQGLVDKTLLEEWLCPMVAMQAVEESNEEDRRLEALLLLCKIATLVGHDLAEKFFLSQFVGLCSHHSPAIRKACAIKMGEMSNVMGTIIVETQLLPKFLGLCRDHEWEIRRCCAEEFMEISWVCQLSTRHQTLTPLFLELLSDTDYVKSAAYQSLGPFISTFVDPMSFSPPPLPATEEGDPALIELQRLQELCAETNKLSQFAVVDQHHQAATPTQAPEEAFNAFQFWREPLPEVDTTLLVGRPNVCVVRPMRQQVSREALESPELISRLEDFAMINLSSPPPSYNTLPESNSHGDLERPIKLLPPYIEDLNKTSPCGNDLELGRSPPKLLIEELGGKVMAPRSQNIVPPLLLEHYISMAAEAGGLSGQCAYSLPAVALTLRHEGWGCLRGAWQALVEDVQWRVRRSLAAALHHLAVILGPQLASSDILPAFWIFLDDLDEVRSALLDHLQHFLHALSPADRHSILINLSAFFKVDNPNNWRYRMTLAHQLQNVADMYSCQHVKEFILPLGLRLLKDRVFTVRQATTKLFAFQLRRFHHKPDFEISVLKDLEEILLNSSKWTLRQMYIFLCEEFVKESALPLERFASNVAPLLLKLSWDPVANVRLAVARLLACIMETHLLAIQRHHAALLSSSLTHLRNDTDRDVLHFIQLVP